MHDSGHQSQKDFADRLGVSRLTVSDVIRFHHYRDKDGAEVESAVANPKQCLCSEGAAPSITAAVIDLRCSINLK